MGSFKVLFGLNTGLKLLTAAKEPWRKTKMESIVFEQRVSGLDEDVAISRCLAQVLSMLF